MSDPLFKPGDKVLFYRSMSGTTSPREDYLGKIVTLKKDEGGHYQKGGSQNWITEEIKGYVVGNKELRYATKLEKALK